jgi:hypothetical protein
VPKSQRVSLPQINKSRKADVGKLNVRPGTEVLLSWEAAERIWRPKTRLWYLSYAAIILFLMLVSARLGYYIVIVALVAFMLLWFVQGTIAPWIIKHKITNRGLFSQGFLVRWEEMACFWFATKEGQTLLYIDFPKTAKEPRMTILVPAGLEYEIFHLLHQQIPYGEESQVEYNFLSRMIYGTYQPLSRFIPDLDDA